MWLGAGDCGRGGLHIINITGLTVLGDVTGSRSTIQTVAAGKSSQSQLLSAQKSASFLDASCGENRCISNSGSSLEMKGKRCSARFGVKPALVCVACSKFMHFTWTDASIINALYKSSLSFPVSIYQSIPRSQREVVGFERQVYTHDFLIYFSTALITAAALWTLVLFSVIFWTTALGCNCLFLPGFCCIARFHLVLRYKEGGPVMVCQTNCSKWMLLNHCFVVKITHATKNWIAASTS